jgi:hypothetical protein
MRQVRIASPGEQPIPLHLSIADFDGAQPRLPEFPLPKPPVAARSASCKMRHIKQEMIPGVLAVRAALPTA